MNKTDYSIRSNQPSNPEKKANKSNEIRRFSASQEALFRLPNETYVSDHAQTDDG